MSLWLRWLLNDLAVVVFYGGLVVAAVVLHFVGELWAFLLSAP